MVRSIQNGAACKLYRCFMPSPPEGSRSIRVRLIPASIEREFSPWHRASQTWMGLCFLAVQSSEVMMSTIFRNVVGSDAVVYLWWFDFDRNYFASWSGFGMDWFDLAVLVQRIREKVLNRSRFPTMVYRYFAVWEPASWVERNMVARRRLKVFRLGLEACKSIQEFLCCFGFGIAWHAVAFENSEFCRYGWSRPRCCSPMVCVDGCQVVKHGSVSFSGLPDLPVSGAKAAVDFKAKLKTCQLTSSAESLITCGGEDHQQNMRFHRSMRPRAEFWLRKMVFHVCVSAVHRNWTIIT